MMKHKIYKLERIEYVRGRVVKRVIVGIYAGNIPAMELIRDIMADYPLSGAYYGLQVNIMLHLARSVDDINLGVIAREFKQFAPKTNVLYYLRLQPEHEKTEEDAITELAV